MRLVDTHAHLYIGHFDEDRDEMIARAVQQDVSQFYLPNIDSSTIGPMLELEAAYPGRCFAMMGLHPGSVRDNYEEELATVRQWLDKRAFCAIGEIGIDLYWKDNKRFFEQQKEAFFIQTEWAKELGVPIVIHARESTDIIIELLQELRGDRLRGIFHCFTGSASQAEAIIDLGFLMGIGGVLSFKKAGLDKTMEQISLKHVVLETDSPYLAPVPFRGKRNESAYLRLIGEKLASVKGISLEELAKTTSENADNIFAYSLQF